MTMPVSNTAVFDAANGSADIKRFATVAAEPIAKYKIASAPEALQIVICLITQTRFAGTVGPTEPLDVGRDIGPTSLVSDLSPCSHFSLLHHFH